MKNQTRAALTVLTSPAQLAAPPLAVRNLADQERAFLATCQRLYREDRGANTPFHNFFSTLVVFVQVGRWPTPESLRQGVAAFEEEQNLMAADAVEFVSRYPGDVFSYARQNAAGILAITATTPDEDGAASTIA